MNRGYTILYSYSREYMNYHSTHLNKVRVVMEVNEMTVKAPEVGQVHPVIVVGGGTVQEPSSVDEERRGYRRIVYNHALCNIRILLRYPRRGYRRIVYNHALCNIRIGGLFITTPSVISE